MRIALTRLRTAILFFSPMVADSQRTQIRDELKWLNAHLGAVRDLDVAIERLRRRRQAAAAGRRPIIAPGTKSARTATAFWRGRFGRPLSAADQETHPTGSRTDPGRIKQGKAGDEGTRRPDRRLQRGQAGAVAAEASEEEPQASENGRGEAASAASVEQEAELFDRILRRPVFGQEIFRTTGRTEISAQGATIARAVERRCQRPSAGGRPATGRRPRALAVSRPEARKAPAADRRRRPTGSWPR